MTLQLIKFKKVLTFFFEYLKRGVTDLVGILIGHLYFFLMFKYPQDYNGAQILTVPDIL